MVISYIIALAVFPLIALSAFFHKYDEGSFDKDFFAKRQTTTLKGIMICIVFFHHFSHKVVNIDWIEYAYRNAQYTIGVFFLLAGYTTCLRYKKTDQVDLKRLWIDRCWRLYLPIIILTLLFNSFMSALLFFFAYTDIIFAKIKSDKARIVALLIGNVFFIVACKMVGMQDYWYDDVFTYWIGAVIAFYKRDITNCLVGDKPKYWSLFITLTIVFVSSYYFAFHWWHYDFSTMIMSTSGALIIFLTMMKVDIRNHFFEFIGKYTFEIFMCHQMIIVVMYKLLKQSDLALISSILATIVTSVLIQRVMLVLKEKVSVKKV